MATREKEEELIFRGRQYARAIGLFQRKFANTAPPTIDLLVEQRFLRKKYKDPITNDDFQPIYANQAAIQPPGGGPTSARPGQSVSASTPAQQAPVQSGFGTTSVGPQGGVIGVTSKSKAESIKIYNGRSKYNEWAFVYVQTSQRPGQSGVPGQGAAPGQQQRPGAARTVRHAAWWTAWRQFPAAAAAGIRSAQPASCQRAEQSIWESEPEWLVHDSEWIDHVHACWPGSASSRRRTVALRSKRSRRAARGARPGCRRRRGSGARDSSESPHTNRLRDRSTAMCR